MGKVIKFKPKKRFSIWKKRDAKTVPFLSKEELAEAIKKRKEIELLRYILKNETSY